MSEVLGPRASYEDLRAGVPDARVREAWEDLDNRALRAREERQRVLDDTDLNDEAKARHIAAIEERTNALLAEGYDKLREKTNKSADRSYKASIPMPDPAVYGQGSAQLKDATELLAAQGETRSLVERARRRRETMSQGGGIGVSGSPELELLQEAYGAALGEGGIPGKIKANAAINAAEELGLSVESLVDPYREEKHRRYKQESQMLDRAWRSIPSGASYKPKMFAGKKGDSERIGANRANAMLVGKEGGQLFTKKRTRRSWK